MGKWVVDVERSWEGKLVASGNRPMFPRVNTSAAALEFVCVSV